MGKKLFVILLLVSAVFLYPAIGRAAQAPGSGEQITINLWHIYVDETDRNRVSLEEFLVDYAKTTPNVKIEQHTLQDADYKPKILTEFSGNAANIDVFSYWGAGRAGDIVNAGKMLCVEDYLSPDQISSIKHGADNNFRYNGKLYGLPRASWMMVLYCNTELFEEHGVKLPETYDEWLEACEKFAAAGIIPVALGGGVDDAWQAAFVYEALVNRIVGAAAVSDVLNNMAGFANDPGFEEAAVKMIQLNSVGAFGRSPLEINEDTANAQFLSGAAAMRLTGSWFTDTIISNPESVVAEKVTALEIPAVPGGVGKSTDYVGGFIDGWFINAATKYPEAAADFVYNSSVYMATKQHAIGEGFTAYNKPVDESGLSPLGKEVSVIANKVVDGVVAWDTFLPGDLADVHLDACQGLLSPRADVKAFMEEYKKIFE